jgi:chromosome segregation ATPase
MEMQIPLLRKLFEARIGEISSIFAQDPPKGLGGIEPVMRGLKGFLFALEGMHRSDYLHGLPFTAVQELGERVDGAVTALQALPQTLNREQAMNILHIVDSLHRLCLQENLMAGGMDANKLGKLTVILEHKLGEVLKTIEGVGGAADGHVERIEQSVAKCLEDIQGVYNSQSEVLQSSASLATESINSQAENISKRQTKVTETLEELQNELGAKREHFQTTMDEHLASAWSMVDEAHNQKQAAGELLQSTTEQLTQAETGIKALDEIARTAQAASEDLQAKMASGHEIIDSLTEKLQSGTQHSEKLASNLAQAQETQTSIEQMQQECTEFTAEARQRQTEAIEAAKETTAAAKQVLEDVKKKLGSQAQAFIDQMQQECRDLADQALQTQTQATDATKASAATADQMLHEAQQKLDSQFETAVKTLAKISARNAAAGSACSDIHQQQQSARQSAEETAESSTQAGEELTKLQDLQARGQEAAATINELVRSGTDMKARIVQTLAEGEQARDRIAQLESETSEASAEIRQGKDQALAAVEKVLSESDKQQRQFTQAMSEHRQAAQDAVAALRSDQTLAADMLGRTQQDIETLHGEIGKLDNLRTSAQDAEAQVRQKLEQANGLSDELGSVLGAAGEVKTQIDGHLTESTAAGQQIETLQQTAEASVRDLRLRQEEALALVLGEIEAAKVQRNATKLAFDSQLAEAQADATGQLDATKASADKQLATAKQTFSEQFETARAAFDGQLEAAATAAAQQLESSQTASTQQLEATRSAAARQLQAAKSASTQQFEAAATAFTEQLEAAKAASAQQFEAAAATFTEQFETAQAAADQQLEASETVFTEQLETAHTASDKQLRAAKGASAQQLQATEAAFTEQFEAAQAAAEQQLHTAQTASAQQLHAAETAFTEQFEAAQAAAEQHLHSAQAAADQQLEATRTAANRQLNSAKAASAEQLKAANAAFTEQFETAQTSFDSQLESASAAAAEQIQTAQAAFSEQLDSAKSTVGQIKAGKSTVDELLQQTQQQRDASLQAGKEIAQIRVDTAESLGETQAKLQESRSAANDLTGLLASGTECRSKIAAELASAVQTSEQVGDIERRLTQSLDQARQHEKQIGACRTQSDKLIEKFQTDAHEALEDLNRQTTDLVDRNEQLQQEIEDLFGQAADGGLFRQFEELVEQSTPERAKWLKLLIASAVGGGVGLALTTTILAAFSSAAAWTVLFAGLTPLAFFLYFCTTQYNDERKAETQNQYRAALSRSMTAYRKLLSSMQAEGIADSPFVDRMLSMLFSQPDEHKEPVALTSAATIQAPEIEQIVQPSQIEQDETEPEQEPEAESEQEQEPT